MHLIEQSGHGVPIVVKQYGKEAFEFGKSFIIVTIPFEQPFTVANETVNATVNATVKLTETQRNILKAMKENPTITIGELAKSLEVNYTTITRNISKLRENGFIEPLGSDKSGTWVVIDK